MLYNQLWPHSIPLHFPSSSLPVLPCIILYSYLFLLSVKLFAFVHYQINFCFPCRGTLNHKLHNYVPVPPPNLLFPFPPIILVIFCHPHKGALAYFLSRSNHRSIPEKDGLHFTFVFKSQTCISHVACVTCTVSWRIHFPPLSSPPRMGIFP